MVNDPTTGYRQRHDALWQLNFGATASIIDPLRTRSWHYTGNIFISRDRCVDPALVSQKFQGDLYFNLAQTFGHLAMGKI
jgi:hypothetical protein